MSNEALEQETTEQTTEQTEPTQPAITMHDPNEVDVKDFKFNSKKELKNKFRRAERIVSIDDPDNPDDTTHFHLRALTPAEEQSLHQQLLSNEDMRGLVSTFIEKAADGESVETEDIAGLVAEKMNGGQNDAGNERYLRKIKMGIIKPSVTIEWLAELNPVILEMIHDVIDELRIEQDRWIVNYVMRPVKEG